MKLYRLVSYKRGYATITFTVTKETKEGYWFLDYEGKKRWTSKTATKRYAYPTIEEAKKSFIFRKQRQIVLLRQQLENTKSQLLSLGAVIPVEVPKFEDIVGSMFSKNRPKD